MEHENLFNLIWGIIKAVVWFVFRLALLVPMLILTFFMAAIGSSKYTISQAISTCICHPFTAFIDAIKQINAEIKIYKSNKY